MNQEATLDDYKILIIPDYKFDSRSIWYSEIANDLDYLGADYEILKMPHLKNPNRVEWINHIKNKLSNTDKKPVLLGHGLGANTASYFVGTQDNFVDTVILVDELVDNSQLDPTIRAFIAQEYDLENMVAKGTKFTFLHSKDSSYSFEKISEIASALGAKIYTFESFGHFDSREDYEVIIDILLEEIDGEDG